MFVETSRLEIREWTSDDFEAFAALMADPEVMRFSLKGSPLNSEEAREYFQKRILDHYRNGFGLWALMLKEEQKIIGFAGLITQEIDGEKKIELAYRLLPHYWHRGLALEAARAICTYAFTGLKLKELISIIDPINTRSIRLAERLGMRPLKMTHYHQKNVYIYAKSSESR
jgi:[ribosomal protein S5]-alanine N-acetyltransferase